MNFKVPIIYLKTKQYAYWFEYIRKYLWVCKNGNTWESSDETTDIILSFSSFGNIMSNKLATTSAIMIKAWTLYEFWSFSTTTVQITFNNAKIQIVLDLDEYIIY